MEKKQRIFAGMFLLVVTWIFAYNLTIFGMDPLDAFFAIAETKNIILTDAISFILISFLVTATFVFADALAQIMRSTQGFAKVEAILEAKPEPGLLKFLAAITRLDEAKAKKDDVPESFSSVLTYSGMMYTFCFIFITAFSLLAYLSITGLEGRALPRVTEVAIPLFAAALPASARFLAILGYSRVKEYSQIIPYSLFTMVLLFLTAMFGMENSMNFFSYVLGHGASGRLLNSALYLAFVPVFLETGWWLYKIEKEA